MLINTDTDTPPIDTNTNLSPSFIHVDDEKNTQESEESHRLQHTAHRGTSDVAHELLDKHHLSNGQGVSDRVTRASGEGDDIRVQTSIAPSRYIRAISHQWDHRLELIDLMVKFREAITCILKYAIHHINLLKKKIYESFGVTENTRSKFREIRGLERVNSLECLNHQSHQQKTDLEKSPDCIKMEDETNLLKNITHKCNDILEELSAHIGPYTDRFKAMVISVINEVNEVKWSFLTDEQAVGILIDGLPTFRMEGLLECAMEIPPAIRSKEGLKLDVNEISCWTPRVERGELKNPSKKTTKPSTVESVTEIESESGGLVILKDENTPKVLDEKKDSNISKVTRHITHPTNPNQNVINPLKTFNSLVCPGGALPFTFRVTASCYDHTEVTLTRLYVGTHCGAVLSLPFDQVVGDDHLTSGCCSGASDVKDGPTEVAKYTELGALSNKEDQKQHETHLEGSHKNHNNTTVGVINNMPIGNTKKLDYSSEKDDLIKLDIVHIDNITSSKKEDPTADVAEKFHPSIRELFNHSAPRNETRKQRLNRESKEAVQQLLTMYTKDPCSVKNPITLNNVTLFPGHVYPVTNLVFIKKYSIIVSASNDKTMRFYNSKTGDVLNVVANTNGTPSSCVYYNPLDVAAIVTYSGTIEFMDIKAGHLAGRMRLNQAIHSVAVDPYTDILFVGTRKGHVYGFRLSVNHCQNRPRLDPLYDEGQVQDCCYCFAPDNSFAYRIDSDVHPITTGAHSAPVTSITPISGFLFTGDDYGKILQWDLESSQLIRKFHSHNDTITSVTVTGDGFMISSSKDALIIIWSIADGSVLRRINRHYHHVIGVFLGFLECVNFPYECGENKKMESKLRNTHKDDTVCTNNTIEKGRLENQTLQKSCNNQLITTLNQKDENTHIISSPTKVSPAHSRSQLSGYHLDNDHSATVSVTSRNCVYSRENITLSSDRLLMISISEDESVVTWSVNYRS